MQQLAEQRSRRDHLLEVVKHQQHLLVAHQRQQLFERKPAAGFVVRKCFGDRGHDSGRVVDACERHDERPIGKLGLEIGGDLHRQAGLADTGRSHQRHQTNIGALEQATHSRDLGCPADQRCERFRQRGAVPGQTCRRCCNSCRLNEASARVGVQPKLNCKAGGEVAGGTQLLILKTLDSIAGAADAFAEGCW